MKKKAIYIGSDHAGFALKKETKKFLVKEGYLIEDLGPYKYNAKDDYPDFALKVCAQVLKTKSKGILICGTGQGMSITANKVFGIRAALCWNKETAKQARQHINTNILCIGSTTVDAKKARVIIKTWLETPFSAEARHVRRINKIKAIERKYSKR